MTKISKLCWFWEVLKSTIIRNIGRIKIKLNAWIQMKEIKLKLVNDNLNDKDTPFTYYLLNRFVFFALV